MMALANAHAAAARGRSGAAEPVSPRLALCRQTLVPAPPIAALRRRVRYREPRREQRLALALAGSLLLHVALFLALTLSRDGLAGAEQGRAVKNSIYAVLRPSSPAAQIATLAASGDAAAGVDAGDGRRPGEQETPPAVDRESRKGGQGAVENRARGDAVEEAVAAPAQAGPRYLFGALLDRQPQLLNEIAIVYPAAAGVQEGRVTLRLLISETGAIDEVAVMHAEPKGFFEEAALSAFAPAEFAPAEVLGKPVKSQFLVEVEFVPFNRGETSGKAY